MKKVKILIMSMSPWNINNSFGNTFTNIFQNLDDKIEIAHIYLREGLPYNNIVKTYFQITEKTLIKNLINKNIPTGKYVKIDKEYILTNLNNNISNYNITYRFFRKHKFITDILLELIWKIGYWKSKDLYDFIKKFNPDILYMPIIKTCYTNDILLYILKETNIPLIGHITDELYFYNKYEKNPIKHIYQFFIRKKIYKLIKKCEFVDTFTDIQKKEYEKIFNIPFKIRYKSANIENIKIKKEYNNPLIFLYTGNLYSNRWKNLVEIGKVLDKINKNEVNTVLNIYSATPLNKEMKREFNNCNSINFMGSVSGEEVQKIQSNADVLIHTESFDKKEIQTVKMSFSTKIIDYISKGKCVLAYGSKEVASIDYFIQNNCGLVIDNPDDLFEKINNLIENKNLILEYGQKALNCAVKNHNKEKLHKQFYEDLCNVLKRKNESSTN